MADKGYAWLPLLELYRDVFALHESSTYGEGSFFTFKIVKVVFTSFKLHYRWMDVFVCYTLHYTYFCLFQIPELARSHPALMTLKSVDLSPASWMAVSW